MAQNFSYTKPLPLSWPEAFQAYMHDPHAKKMLRRFAVKFLPLATGFVMLDDLLLPGLGLIDDVTWPFLVGGLIVMLYKVNRYRYNPGATPPKI